MSIFNVQVMGNGPRYVVVNGVFVPDADGQENVVFFDATDPTYAVVVQGQAVVPGPNIKVQKIQYSINSVFAVLSWGQDLAFPIAALTGYGTLDFTAYGGLSVPPGNGLTGIIYVNSVVSNSPQFGFGYTLLVQMTKGVPQS